MQKLAEWIAGDSYSCRCIPCDKTFSCKFAHIERHAESSEHIKKCIEKGVEPADENDRYEGFDNDFQTETKISEIRFAALLVELNIPFQKSSKILNFFQSVKPEVLKAMRLSRTEGTKIVTNVLYPMEKKYSES